MKKNRWPIIIVTGLIVVLAGAVIALLVFIKNQPEPVRGVVPMITVADMEPDSSIWGQNFPNQYTTMLQTKYNNERTPYGGSENFSKLEADPRLVTLFAGYPFSKGYDEDRGHEYALEDVKSSVRISNATTGTCYSCKSADNPKLWADMGLEAFDSTKFSELGKSLTHTIGCSNCHEANTMRLIVTNPSLVKAFESQGIDWTKFTRQEMRSVVCANCHVEYYMVGEGKLLTLPWENGTGIDQIAAYYTEEGFTDWTHPQSGASLIKMQHPDFELYSAGSTHYNAGVACADCHMPYTRDGSAKFSTHDIKSPLLRLPETCGVCHTNVDYVAERVQIIQDSVYQTMIKAEDAIIAAITAIEEAEKQSPIDEALIDEARELHRQAQLRWDFIAAENSMGFHNPEEALRILADAIDLARQAQTQAILAGK
ncbi:MAG TPA: ammonia-forming cytochrome c nitrite reductase subunit c552 [Anaerolineaceae bacterium]|nr:ammonia-forming cytochrome c nitrite reductase subunit c552 [Anaerolineaceae bacterium]